MSHVNYNLENDIRIFIIDQGNLHNSYLWPSIDYFWVGWLCLTSHRHRGHLETAPPFTVPYEGREARILHRTGGKPRAVTWQSFTQPLRHTSSPYLRAPGSTFYTMSSNCIGCSLTSMLIWHILSVLCDLWNRLSLLDITVLFINLYRKLLETGPGFSRKL